MSEHLKLIVALLALALVLVLIAFIISTPQGKTATDTNTQAVAIADEPLSTLDMQTPILQLKPDPTPSVFYGLTLEQDNSAIVAPDPRAFDQNEPPPSHLPAPSSTEQLTADPTDTPTAQENEPVLADEPTAPVQSDDTLWQPPPDRPNIDRHTLAITPYTGDL